MELDQKTITIILIIIAAAVLAYLAYKYFVKKPSPTPQQQAVVVPPPMTPSPSPSQTPPPVFTPAFAVLTGSYLATYNGSQVTIVNVLPPIGDTTWVIINTPTGVTVLEPLPVNIANNLISLGVLINGQSVTVTVSSFAPASVEVSGEFKQESVTYAAYATEQIPLTIGTLRSIIRGNKQLFNQLYNAVALNNQAAISAILGQYQNNPAMYNLLKQLATPRAMVAPMAISYNAGITLGVVPPQVQSYVTNPTSTVIDFGYAY